MASVPEILENLRRASVQHGGAIRTMLEDIKAMGVDLKRVIAKQEETDAQIAQLVADLQTVAGSQPATADGEATGGYDDDGSEEDAEYEEAGG